MPDTTAGSGSDGSAVLLLSCKDRTGLISRMSHFVFERGGNIVDLDEHVDGEYFFLRIAWEMKNFSIPESEVRVAFTPLAKEFNATWQISFTSRKQRVALFVSRLDHCLQEILWRQRMGEFDVEICHVISNHEDLRPLAEHTDFPTLCFRLRTTTALSRKRRSYRC